MLVDSYTSLRQREGTGAGKTWRVTVRQLESLIRLSEALAKVECSDEVGTRHVQEAKRLLNNSIVRVEQPDIELEDDVNAAPMDVDDSVDEPVNGINGGGNFCHLEKLAHFLLNLKIWISFFFI